MGHGRITILRFLGGPVDGKQIETTAENLPKEFYEPSPLHPVLIHYYQFTHRMPGGVRYYKHIGFNVPQGKLVHNGEEKGEESA